MPDENVEYRGKSYKLLNFPDALAEYKERKVKGESPVVVSIKDRYIVSEAIFAREELEGGKK